MTILNYCIMDNIKALHKTKSYKFNYDVIYGVPFVKAPFCAYLVKFCAYLINMHKILLNMHKMVLLQMVPHSYLRSQRINI